MNLRQVTAPRYIIFRSKDGGSLSKQILTFLLSESKGAGEEVGCAFQEDREGFTADELQEVVHDIEIMLAKEGATHLTELMILCGSPFRFSLEYGPSDDTGIPDSPYYCSFWFSKRDQPSASTVKLLDVSRERIEGVSIDRSGLYPEGD